MKHQSTRPWPLASSQDSIDQSAAARELDVAWQQYRNSTIQRFRDGLAFGRICYEWRSRYKAQGSRTGNGFDHVLHQLGIPKTTAYRWISRFEAKCSLRPTRNEVATARNSSRPSHMREKRLSFQFILDEQEHRTLRERIKNLGGHRVVSDMILRFIRDIAFERLIVSYVDNSPLNTTEDVKQPRAVTQSPQSTDGWVTSVTKQIGSLF